MVQLDGGCGFAAARPRPATAARHPTATTAEAEPVHRAVPQNYLDEMNKRMLQEAVDVLFDNVRGEPTTGDWSSKSLLDMLKGK